MTDEWGGWLLSGLDASRIVGRRLTALAAAALGPAQWQKLVD